MELTGHHHRLAHHYGYKYAETDCDQRHDAPLNALRYQAELDMKGLVLHNPTPGGYLNGRYDIATDLRPIGRLKSYRRADL